MEGIPTIEDVYRKFGEASEAAQLLETEMGTLLMNMQCTAEGLMGSDGIRATEIMRTLNRSTLGGLIHKAKSGQSVEDIEDLLEGALKSRNLLMHSFYRKHNFRKFSAEGRVVMLRDLENIHATIFSAYKALMLLGGTDLDALAKEPFIPPTGHVPI